MNDQTTSMWLARGRSRWALPVLALSLASAALASALLVHLRIAENLRIESKSQRALIVAADQAMQAEAAPCDPQFAYEESLPTSMALDKLVLNLQENSKAFGIALLSVSGESHRAGDRGLASMVVNIALQGRYAGVKATLAESLSRFPTGVLQVIHVKRAAGVLPPVEDASIQIAFPLRPAALGPADCRLPSAHQITGVHQ